MSRSPRSKSAKPFQNYPLDEQIQRAMPVARQLIAEGISYGARRDLTTAERVQEVVNDPRLTAFFADEPEEECARLENWLAAAVALGIGLGLMLQRETFVARAHGAESDTKKRVS
jgi:hypothetical protein